MAPTSGSTDDRARSSSLRLMLAFGGLSALLAAGYGVLFTIVDDYRDEYGISETAIGIVIGAGFISAFVSQVLVAPFADRGHSRVVVIAGVAVNAAGLLLMGLGTTLPVILIGRIVSGIGIGAATPAIKRIVILADPQTTSGRNLGSAAGSAEVFGFAMGPVDVGGDGSGPFGIPAPFYTIAALDGDARWSPIVAGVRVRGVRPTPPVSCMALDLLRIRPFAGAVVYGHRGLRS